MGFSDRLAYLRWVRSARLGKAETDRELADAFGVGYKWLAKWKGSEKSPDGRSEEAAIEVAIGREATKWLYDNAGDPPDVELWQAWARRRGIKRALKLIRTSDLTSDHPADASGVEYFRQLLWRIGDRNAKGDSGAVDRLRVLAQAVGEDAITTRSSDPEEVSYIVREEIEAAIRSSDSPSDWQETAAPVKKDTTRRGRQH